MRVYCQVHDWEPSDEFQPHTAVTVIDRDGAKIELFFADVNKMWEFASHMNRCADEAYAEITRLRSKWLHLAEEIADDERDATVRDDYEWPEDVAS